MPDDGSLSETIALDGRKTLECCVWLNNSFAFDKKKHNVKILMNSVSKYRTWATHRLLKINLKHI